MASLFEQGEKSLHDLFDVTSELISYKRTGLQILEDIPAKVAKPSFKTSFLSVGQQIGFTSKYKDFIIKQSSIESLMPPEPGDEIVYKGKTYMAVKLEDAPCYSEHTSHSEEYKQIRIHTECTGAA